HLDLTVAARRYRAHEPTRPIARRRPQGARSVVLPRAHGDQWAPEITARGSVGRTGLARSGHIRQLRRIARAASPVERAPDRIEWSKTTSGHPVHHGGGRPLGSSQALSVHREKTRIDRTHRTHAAEAIRCCILAAAGARSRMAAGMARVAASLSAAGEPR